MTYKEGKREARKEIPRSLHKHGKRYLYEVAVQYFLRTEIMRCASNNKTYLYQYIIKLNGDISYFGGCRAS